MGFFKRVIEKKDIEDHKKDREISEDISKVDLERLYLKLYMKISRDFVMKKDYERVIEELKYSAGIEEDGDVDQGKPQDQEYPHPFFASECDPGGDAE